MIRLRFPRITLSGVVSFVLNSMLVLGLAYAICERPPL